MRGRFPHHLSLLNRLLNVKRKRNKTSGVQSPQHRNTTFLPIFLSALTAKFVRKQNAKEHTVDRTQRSLTVCRSRRSLETRLQPITRFSTRRTSPGTATELLSYATTGPLTGSRGFQPLIKQPTRPQWLSKGSWVLE